MSPDPSPDDPVRFVVPTDLREYAPDGAAVVAVDPTTLAVSPVADATAGTEASSDADAGSDPGSTVDSSRIHPSFPTGRAGVATVLLLGKLDALATERAAAATLVEAAEGAGGDVLLTLDRLAEAAAAGELDPDVDLARRRHQLVAFLDL
jgi:hypothetical protein